MAAMFAHEKHLMCRDLIDAAHSFDRARDVSFQMAKQAYDRDERDFAARWINSARRASDKAFRLLQIVADPDRFLRFCAWWMVATEEAKGLLPIGDEQLADAATRFWNGDNAADYGRGVHQQVVDLLKPA